MSSKEVKSHRTEFISVRLPQVAVDAMRELMRRWGLSKSEVVVRCLEIVAREEKKK